MKNIIREVSDPDFEFYFDGDCFNKYSGDYNNTLFIITSDYYGYSHHYYSALNKEDFEDLKKDVSYCLTDVEDKIDGYNDYFKSVKEIMEYYNLPYNPTNCKKLKDLANGEDFESPKTLAAYLSIKTGKKWDTYVSRGYCQGDYAEIVFCRDNYKEDDLNIISDMYWGMGKEFCILFDGDEDNAVYGYYIADCEYRTNEDLKTYFCKMEGFEEDETVLEMISGSRTYTKYEYTEY